MAGLPRKLYSGMSSRMEIPCGENSRVGRGSSIGEHNYEARGMGTFPPPGIHGKGFGSLQTQYQKPCGVGREVTNNTFYAANCDITRSVVSPWEKAIPHGFQYTIKSYCNKLEVSFPENDPNEKEMISYDVWYQQTEMNYREKVQAKLPYQSVTIENLDAATWYKILITKLLNGEPMSRTKQYVFTSPFGPPDNFSVKRDSDGMVHFEWCEPGTIASGYYIEEYFITVSNYVECDEPQGKQFKYDGSTHNTSIKLKKETSYVFQIEASCGDHFSEPSKAELLMPKHRMLKDGKKIETKRKPTYLLAMADTTDGHGKLCRKELGTPLVSKMPQNEKVVLVVGAAGNGKTTWINAILNYILNVKYTDDFRFKLVIDEYSPNQAVSQTQYITIYTIHHQDGFNIDYTLTIIDTPGFGDTHGIEKDKEIEQDLRKIFEPANGGVDQLHAIGFVASASLVRLTPTQQYISHSILKMFGDDIRGNIYMLFTFADGKPPQIMSAIKVAKIPYKECFKFNNSAIFDDTLPENEGDDDHQEIDDESEYFNKMFWELGMNSFHRFLSKLRIVEAQSLTLSRDVLNERGRIEMNVENLYTQIRLRLSKMDQLRSEEELIKTIEDSIESNKNFTYEFKRLEVKKIEIPEDRNTTTCLICNFTCHKNCAFRNNVDKDKCWAMDKSKYPVSCTQCPDHCAWHAHRNISYILEQNMVTETSTLYDLKARYEKASGNKLAAEQIVRKVQEELDTIETEIKVNLLEVSTSIQRLQQIALESNPMTQIECLDILIESEMNSATPGWQGRLKGLQHLRQQAQDIHDISHGEYNPFSVHQEQVEKASLEGCDMPHVSS